MFSEEIDPIAAGTATIEHDEALRRTTTLGKALGRLLFAADSFRDCWILPGISDVPLDSMSPPCLCESDGVVHVQISIV
ncbi:hypothetical protein AXA44_34510 [Rhodococcus sp. SC4]|nr:hypothetical protein AXA44_34510 [Rhodococcus sp. SC4]